MNTEKERTQLMIYQEIEEAKKEITALSDAIRKAEMSVSIKLLAELNEKQTALMLLVIEMQNLVLAGQFHILYKDMRDLRISLAKKL